MSWRTSGRSCPNPTKVLDNLDLLAGDFDGTTFEWDKVRPFGLVSHVVRQSTQKVTCGKLLAHCLEKVDSFRTRIGIRVCIFKIGVMHNPLIRYKSYLELKYTEMWLLATSPSVDLVHMLEAALVCQYSMHVGCRNKKGEGFLNRTDAPAGPYFVYIVGGRADQNHWVGWAS